VALRSLLDLFRGSLVHGLDYILGIAPDPVEFFVESLGVTVIKRPGHGQDVADSRLLKAPIAANIIGI
jgi:hypothetical protein